MLGTHSAAEPLYRSPLPALYFETYFLLCLTKVVQADLEHTP